MVKQLRRQPPSPNPDGLMNRHRRLNDLYRRLGGLMNDKTTDGDQLNLIRRVGG